MLLVNTLAGVNCTDGLRILMVDLGIIKSLDSCQSELEALAILREKLGIPEKINPEEHENRVTNWVGSSKPGIFDKERQKKEKKTRQDALVRRWSLKAKIQRSGQLENRLIDDSSPEDDMWQQLDHTRKHGESNTEDEDGQAPRKLPELPQLSDPFDKPRPKRKEKKKKRNIDAADQSTRVPNVSRVSVYKESSSSTCTYTSATSHTVEYWKSPSTLSDDLFDYYSPNDEYSEIFSNEESVPSFIDESAEASTKRGYYKPRAADGRREKAQFQAGPSERLKEYAKLNRCIKEDKDFLKKALSSESPESSDQRNILKDKDFLKKALSSQSPESSDQHNISKM
ncbi:uncharacterized protein LOC130014284 [Patella vulgata]|uniref:uncharacterized protein LOC130014284 n=1 Tax=Patella vulgata TaxID=6465 RepID=UPI0024A95CFB|nr:uncharacterized protein LOC130014284 [Patella vulgata]